MDILCYHHVKNLPSEMNFQTHMNIQVGDTPFQVLTFFLVVFILINQLKAFVKKKKRLVSAGRRRWRDLIDERTNALIYCTGLSDYDRVHLDESTVTLLLPLSSFLYPLSFSNEEKVENSIYFSNRIACITALTFFRV